MSQKYLSLPLALIEFWYPEGIAFFLRTWKNLMLFLEEDLAVGLMWRLLFTPLFHDATIVGRFLSFLFRLSRIFYGLFGFALASVVVFALAVFWLTLPLLAALYFTNFYYLFPILVFCGVGIFLIEKLSHPHKKVWQIKKGEDFWSAAEISKENLSFKKLLSDKEVNNLLSNLEIQINRFPNWEIKDSQAVGLEAFNLAKKMTASYISASYFFVAALKELPGIDEFLLKLDLKMSDFEDALLYLEKKRQIWKKVYLWDDEFIVHHLKGVNRGWLGVPTPTLDLFSEDFTKKAAKGEFADFNFVRSDGVLEEIVNILSQPTGRNVIVVSPAGAGKSALVRHLAKQIVLGDAPQSLATKRLVLLDFTRLLSGVKTQGDLADRIREIFEEVEFAQNVIIVIEEIHELGMGEVGSSLNLYSLMESYLESDTFQFIGTTEPENYSKILEKNSSFARIFRKIELEPASVQDTLSILEYRSINEERKSKIKTTFLAIKSCLELAQKFIRDRVLPDSAISVLKEAQTQSVNGWVNREVIRRVVSQTVKVPMMDVGNVDKARLLNLEDEIHQRMIDQQQAVKAVADSLRRSVTGMREEGRPIGSFLFVGPTGVGKTELAKTLADVYFKTEGAFLRFDMSEYSNSESIVRLIGAAGEGGLLTESIRSRPYALILLDEFEKANDKILTLFLQVLDDGRLTDGAGRTIDFENTIIIATSNAASLIIAQGLKQGRTLEEIDKDVNDELLKVFRPELVNRFDEVVLFKPLSQEDLQKIVQIKLTILQKQMKDKGYLVEFEPALISALAQKGFDPVLGARPLRRLIQDTLEAKLSRLILEGKLTKGSSLKVGVELLS